LIEAVIKAERNGQVAPLKVGEVAKRAGISVRALHHYDEIGLLSPSGRSEAGYRLYGDAEIVRLQQFVSLRQLGLSLGEIQSCLRDAGYSPRRVIDLHIARLREQISAQRRLCERLEALAGSLDSKNEVSVAEVLETIKEISWMDKYYTPEQLEELKQRAEKIGQEHIREVEAEWPVLMAKVRAEMDKGTDPTSETVRALAARWMELVREFTGGNPGIERSLGKMYQQEETVHGMDVAPMREMMAYIQKALAASQ
jgi:MerR family transcriptional regulator, thiopeptide resistance regulator